MSFGAPGIPIEQALRDIQDAEPNERALVVTYLLVRERQRKDPDKKLLRELVKIANHRKAHEEHVALYRRNAHRTWLETLIKAKKWAREELGKRERSGA